MTDAAGRNHSSPREEALEPRRREERERVSGEVASRLRDRGVGLTGRESSEEIVTLLEAVERFEGAVEAKGGDLMVDEAPRARTTQPDDPRFVLPQRKSHEPVAEYLERIEEATSVVLLSSREHR